MLVVEQFESLAVFGVATVDFGLPNTPWQRCANQCIQRGSALCRYLRT